MRNRFQFYRLMTACPTLRNLQLIGFVFYEPNSTDEEERQLDSQRSLYTLDLLQCRIDSHVMDCVATYCPRLKNLRLHQVTYTVAEQTCPVFPLHLPNNHLHNLRICDLKLRRPPGHLLPSVRLISLRTHRNDEKLRNAPFADHEATWFSLYPVAVKAVNRRRRGVSFTHVTTICCDDNMMDDECISPIKCYAIKKPEAVELICLEINSLQHEAKTRVHHTLARTDVVETAQGAPVIADWQPAATIDYFGYLSLRCQT